MIWNVLKNVFIENTVRPLRKQVFEGYRVVRFVRSKDLTQLTEKKKT